MKANKHILEAAGVQNENEEYDRYYILGVHKGKIPVDDNEKIFYKEDNSTAVEQDRDVI